MKSKNMPKVLVFDIETAPLLSYCWGLWDQTIGLNQIKHDWYVLAWAAKWLHDGPRKVMYEDQRAAKDIENDNQILKKLWKLLDECDYAVTHNGTSFDKKKVNARFALHGMQPPSSYQMIDTKKIAKKHFAFTSNKLAYLTDKLCTKYKKLDHGKFYGFNLWKECLAGNKKAWKEMEKYNKYDVLSLEELYLKMQPWDNTLNVNLFTPDDAPLTCACGSTRFAKNGFKYTSVGKYQRYKCLECGSESKDRKNLLSKEKKEKIRR